MASAPPGAPPRHSPDLIQTQLAEATERLFMVMAELSNEESDALAGAVLETYRTPGRRVAGVPAVPELDDLTRLIRRRATTNARASRSRAPQCSRPRLVARPRERRASSSSSTSSSDPGSDSDEPEPAPRVCACGCGRDISHKRVGALSFDSSCRKRIQRADVDALAADVREERHLEWAKVGLPPFYAALARDSAPGDQWLTADLERELHAIYEAGRQAQSEATTPRRTEMDGLAVTRWLMETNGVATASRHRGSPWTSSRSGGLRTRSEVIA